MRILAAFAHPDDECFCSGGTLARYTASGAEAMVISATKGDAGQIHDSYRTTRQTLGHTREEELKAACAALGVQHVRCLDYPDGGLSKVDMEKLVKDLLAVLHDFQPDVVLTFGHDGGYGHPDHVAISYATEEAVRRFNSERPQTARLYFAFFPQKEMLLVEELSNWLMTKDLQYRESMDFLKALSIFAEESTMLRYSNDFVDTNWYPPGFCIVEQGEQSNKLYVILSGTVDVMREADAGELQPIARLGVGQFFGETGIAHKQVRNAYVIAQEATTCLEFAYQEPTL
ncbi:MAG: PIG-L family deacetylase, partial [Anaerolineae bacterium]|nr:PIG-L family deacetylase [Anaerolineae bacterium]